MIYPYTFDKKHKFSIKKSNNICIKYLFLSYQQHKYKASEVIINEII